MDTNANGADVRKPMTIAELEAEHEAGAKAHAERVEAHKRREMLEQIVELKTQFAGRREKLKDERKAMKTKAGHLKAALDFLASVENDELTTDQLREVRKIASNLAAGHENGVAPGEIDARPMSLAEFSGLTINLGKILPGELRFAHR
ncbi:hypothetical protein [Ancylobacter rudongensis]|uniref:Uncharacterized protein n=1 Tax=Ancylobacter rudongensis TaxID=177413 RepID=A0A1G4USH2_9HYPH|nr:hypothetical protein [Ancylobacter rudongensis]SCW95925.1 hypothetical protein SAMN05660859_0149 [Ancylobacter rudongensis]